MIDRSDQLCHRYRLQAMKVRSPDSSTSRNDPYRLQQFSGP